MIRQPSRFRLFREHKYVSNTATDLLFKIGITDFSSSSAVEQLKKQLNQFFLLISAHSNYEEERIHRLLKSEAIEAKPDHISLDKDLKEIISSLETLEKENLDTFSHQIYLKFRLFLANLFFHFDNEEVIIMKHLHDNYSDQDIRKIDHISYNQMNSEQIFHMLETLFLHFNSIDREAFLLDIHDCEPQKFAAIWPLINEKLLTSGETRQLCEKIRFE